MAYDGVTYPVNVQPGCVVGIGASAGGLEALEQFLTFLPKNTGMAFIIIQHLSPDHKSLLVDILSKYTSMPVNEIQDGMQLERNHVYTLPPKYNVEITSDVLHLKEYDHSQINHPIDVFLRSLAQAYENRAVAVILSGTGSDGTNGIRSIKEQNGMIIVQDPDSAKFDGMPKNAISTGFVDLILKPDAIGKEMAHIAGSMSDTDGKLQLTDGDLLSRVFSILKSVTNINYTYYKQTTILRRIERRIVVTHCQNLQSYVEFLKNNEDEAKALAKEVLIGVTSFFRDPEYFETLKNRVIREIIKKTRPKEQIRVWVAGCSTGEEAYSIAILFAEVMEEEQLVRDIKIFATDLDADSVQVASRGVYSENIIEDVSVSRLSRFFTRKGGKYIVNHDIRKMIVFAQHNVFQDPPFGRLDLISCRNLLIYFQTVLQKNLFGIFHVALKDGGCLFLGKSESIGDYSDVFRPYCANEKIFVHNATGKLPAHEKIKYSLDNVENNLTIKMPERLNNRQIAGYTSAELNLKVLEELLPATIVIDVNNELRHSFGDCSKILTIPVGKSTLDIFLLLRTDLRIAVSTALKECRDKEKKITYDKIPVTVGEDQHYITLVAMPLPDKMGEKTGMTVLSFIREGQTDVFEATHYDVNAAAAKRISDLEKELKVTQDNLHQTVMELESVNAELQAANEELLTSNEELQSSNEELQSVNEELYTVNSEYQSKVSEFAAVNNDMANFLSSTLVGIMLVDKNLNIRKFTEYISTEFKIADQDVGRSLHFLAYNFASINLIDLSKKVLATKDPVECQTSSVAGKTYLIRIAPYRVSDDSDFEDTEKGHEKREIIKGLVLTVVDMTRQANDEQQLKQMSAALQIAARTSQEKESFLSNMSHDMRTPLTAIMGLLELSLREENVPGVIRQNLEKMQSSSRYLLDLIDEVLETSKLDAGKVVTAYDTVHEMDVLEEVNAIIEEKAKGARVQYVFEVRNCSNEIVMMDMDHVARVLINLLGNAVKFTPAGGTVAFRVHADYQNGHVVRHTYTISDTGCGISPDFMKRMYLPFEQDIQESAGHQEGTGLGLFICKRLTELMNGSIQCESEVGKGTTFTVVFTYDLASNDQIRLHEKKQIAQKVQNIEGMHVLIAEDNQLNAEVILDLLSLKGVKADIAVNGRDAVEKYKKAPAGTWQAILMDLRMPVLDGFEATQEIRSMKDPEKAKVPIIALSAEVYEKVSSECMKAGMNAYLAKPVNSHELYEVLEKSTKE